MFLDQQITEISACIQATNVFIQDYKLSESCKYEMYKKMSKNMLIFDDDTDNFYEIVISENGSVFIGNVTEVNVELLWDSMSLYMTGIDIDHRGLIPISVIVSIQNRYVWITSALETVFSHKYIENQSNTEILFPTTISNVEASTEDIHSFNMILSDMYDISASLSNLYINISEKFSDIYKYYKPCVYITFYRSTDMTGRIVNIGTLYDYIDFTMLLDCTCNCIKIDLKDNGANNIMDIPKLKISVEKCEYKRNVFSFPTTDIVNFPWNIAAPFNALFNSDIFDNDYPNDDEYDEDDI